MYACAQKIISNGPVVTNVCVGYPGSYQFYITNYVNQENVIKSQSLPVYAGRLCSFMDVVKLVFKMSHTGHYHC
ncbi:hypothetical protein GGD38_005100 [Chitinophagaceae bacterium OAS944]|nr:hypothetical protein [Chitinophagaceae bacterium OAS944]